MMNERQTTGVNQYDLGQTWTSGYSSHMELPVKPNVWIEGKPSKL